jgi:hypothetical protein
MWALPNAALRARLDVASNGKSSDGTSRLHWNIFDMSYMPDHHVGKYQWYDGVVVSSFVILLFLAASGRRDQGEGGVM